MSVVKSQLFKEIKHTYNLPIGNVYFFDNFLIVEFGEGLNLTFDSLTDFFSVIKKHFGTKKPFGIIANRLNSYSQVLMDAKRFEEELKNIVEIAIITYSTTAEKNIEYENYFYKTNRTHFDNLIDAAKWMDKKVVDSK